MKLLLSMLLLLLAGSNIQAQTTIQMPEARFMPGDNSQWKLNAFDDSRWPLIKTYQRWETQGYDKYDGFAWYRFHVTIPASLQKNAYWKDSLTLYLAYIDDVDEAWLNGTRIGQTGSFPQDSSGYLGQFAVPRYYRVALKSSAIKWDSDNVIAVRVLDHGSGGGFWGDTPFVNVMQPADAVNMLLEGGPGAGPNYKLRLLNQSAKKVAGTLKISFEEEAQHRIVSAATTAIQLEGKQAVIREISVPRTERLKLSVVFTEKYTGKALYRSLITPYILTPPASPYPQINGAMLTGIRPGTPFLYRIAATGKPPLRYSAGALPAGLSINQSTGVISGMLADSGSYHIQLRVDNVLGKAEKVLTIQAGRQLALLPPMGWNSWNSMGVNVSAATIMQTMHALTSKGLTGHGWSYINVDDGWTSPQRTADGKVLPNEKFSNMKALGDSLHANGWLFGIYSSPGPLTCGNYMGSYNHEGQDAASFAEWGVDYLKYDWCSYENIAGNDTSLAIFQKPYSIMQQALESQPRSIVYSLCQYGQKEVWKWGALTGGHAWRTTDDIRDSWHSVYGIATAEAGLYSYAGPGHWNDPDMLTIGLVGGWLGSTRPSLLTPDEQYTHVSLWSLLSAPLLIGCDAELLDGFTLSQHLIIGKQA